MKIKYMTPEKRKKQILVAAVKEAQKKTCFTVISVRELAKKLKLSYSLMYHYFSSVEQLRKEVIEYAIQNEIIEILAQLMLAKDKRVLNLPIDIKKRVVDFILN